MSTVSTERDPLPGVDSGVALPWASRRRSQRGEGAKDVVAFDAQEFVDAPCRRPSGAPGRPGI